MLRSACTRLWAWLCALWAPASLAPMLAELRQAGVVEAQFYPSGRPSRLLLSPAPKAAQASSDSDSGPPRSPPGDPLYWGLRRRPGEAK